MKPPARVDLSILPLSIRDGYDEIIVAPVKIEGEYKFMVTIVDQAAADLWSIYLDKKALDKIAGYAARIVNPQKDNQ